MIHETTTETEDLSMVQTWEAREEYPAALKLECLKLAGNLELAKQYYAWVAGVDAPAEQKGGES